MRVPLEAMAAYCRWHFQTKPCETCVQREVCEALGVPVSVYWTDLERVEGRGREAGPFSLPLIAESELRELCGLAECARKEGVCNGECYIGQSPACASCPALTLGEKDWPLHVWEMPLETLMDQCEGYQEKRLCGMSCPLYGLCKDLDCDLPVYRYTLLEYGLWEDVKGYSLWQIFNSWSHGCEACPMARVDRWCTEGTGLCPRTLRRNKGYWDVLEVKS